jgi:hypothetical protein
MSRRPRRLHPMVRGYLRDLDLALAPLPWKQRDELRKQMRAHLADALPKKPSTHEVATVLSRLGPPSEVSEEAASGTTPETRIVIATRRIGARVRHAGWQSLVLSGISVVVIGAVGAYLIAFLTAPLIQPGGANAWYGEDGAHAVDSQADDVQQTTVPIRSGKRQGLLLTIYNPSDFTETVLGLASTTDPFGTPLQILVSEPNPEVDIGGMVNNVVYTLPESIPPHQFRQVVVKWTSTACLAKHAQVGITQIQLRVSMSFMTWTDVIPLGEGFYLSGPSQGQCRRQQ